MPITVGSVGDIISLVLLVKDVIGALDEARGSVAEYQEVRRELTSLERALLEVDLISRTDVRTPEINALFETVRHAARNCRRSVEAFGVRIKGYGPSFEEGEPRKQGMKAAILDTTRKMGWMMSQKDAVTKFRAEIGAHTSSINMLLATATLKLSTASQEQLSSQLQRASLEYQTANDEQQSTLSRIEGRLRAASTEAAATTQLLLSVKETVNLQWLHQLGAELKEMIGKIITMHTATYKAVMTIQACFPSYLERLLYEEGWILEDAIGRVSPISFQFIENWDAFDAVLEIRFRDIQGYHKIKDKKYVLQAQGTGMEVSRKRQFRTAFVSGKKYEMSLLFNVAPEASSAASCPSCQIISDETSNANILCKNCGLWFCRMTEFDDVEPPMSVFSEQPSTPSLVSLSGKRKVETTGFAEEDMTSFKRVRLISKKRRHKMTAGPLQNSAFGVNLASFKFVGVTNHLMRPPSVPNIIIPIPSVQGHYRPFVCMVSGCEAPLFKKRDLIRHMEAEHNKIKKRFICGTCDEKTRRKEGYIREEKWKNHNMTHHNVRVSSTFKCPFCTGLDNLEVLCFGSKESFQHHFDMEHDGTF